MRVVYSIPTRIGASGPGMDSFEALRDSKRVLEERPGRQCLAVKMP